MMHSIQTPEEYEAGIQRVQELQQRSLPEEAEELAPLLKLIERYEKSIAFLTEGKPYVNEIFIEFVA